MTIDSAEEGEKLPNNIELYLYLCKRTTVGGVFLLLTLPLLVLSLSLLIGGSWGLAAAASPLYLGWLVGQCRAMGRRNVVCSRMVAAGARGRLLRMMRIGRWELGLVASLVGLPLYPAAMALFSFHYAMLRRSYRDETREGGGYDIENDLERDAVGRVRGRR